MRKVLPTEQASLYLLWLQVVNSLLSILPYVDVWRIHTHKVALKFGRGVKKLIWR